MDVIYYYVVKKISLIFCFVVLFAMQSFCQSLSDTIAIRKVDISPTNLPEGEVFKKHFDSLTITQYKTASLGDLLNESGIFIKSFGAGSVATASAYGTSAYHTQVYWNGIPINNAMLGLSDFALMPVTFADEIFISNSSDEKGNASIGNSVHINARPFFENRFTISFLQSGASFQNYKTHVGTNISSEKQSAAIKLIHEQGKNNFPFTNTALYTNPEQKQSNNKVQQDGFTVDYFLKPKQNHLLSAHAWMQKVYRQNPPSMTTDKSVAYQNDIANRFLVNYVVEKKIAQYKLQLGWLNESINYVDSFINLESFGRVKTLVSDFTSFLKISKTIFIDAVITNSHFFAFADEYNMHREQNRLGIFCKLNFKNKKQTVFASLNAREEILNDKTNPVSVAYDSKIKLAGNLFFEVNVATANRQPTLNDLYWVPGGNPNLKPEKSFCQNTGLSYDYFKNKISISVSASAFNKNISNWIQWLPGSTGYWEPQNVYKVWARGMEGRSWFMVHGSRLKCFVEGNFCYTRSTRNEKKNDELNNKQLIYVPEVTSNATAGIFFKGSGIFYSVNYKSERYTSSDNKQYLKPYTLHKISAQQKIALSKKMDGHLRFAIKNLFNTTYQTIAYRPMPKINYEITLQLNFKHNINKHKK